MSDINLRLLGIWVDKPFIPALNGWIYWRVSMASIWLQHTIQSDSWMFLTWRAGWITISWKKSSEVVHCPLHVLSVFSPLQMLLHLFSDANYNLLGFNATYSFSVCPGACGCHGRCDMASSLCQCHLGWGGADCSTPLCPQACILHGTCDKVRRGRLYYPHWKLCSL